MHGSNECSRVYTKNPKNNEPQGSPSDKGQPMRPEKMDEIVVAASFNLPEPSPSDPLFLLSALAASTEAHALEQLQPEKQPTLDISDPQPSAPFLNATSPFRELNSPLVPQYSSTGTLQTSPVSSTDPMQFNWCDFTFFDELNQSLESLNPPGDGSQSQLELLMNSILPTGNVTPYPVTPREPEENNPLTVVPPAALGQLRIPASHEVPINERHSGPPPPRTIEKKLEEVAWTRFCLQLQETEKVMSNSYLLIVETGTKRRVSITTIECS
jgi:hypothetical protein